ncbi:alpha/beta fold hydrolase [Candidatus Roizmanbacteria bacterium]|nr:alpha/beta fold hydrolase [Candidatus Roizmanbacteria bacterium]
MQYSADIKSKSGKQISILVFQASEKPKLTLIESHGGFQGSKEKVAENNKQLIDFALQNNINYISIDLSNNGTQKDQPFNEIRYSNRVKDVETVIDFVKEKFNSPVVLIGSSLGGLITLNAAAYTDIVSGLILNCPALKAHLSVEYTMDSEEFKNWKKGGVAIWSGVPFTYDFYTDIKSLDGSKILKSLAIPILWFHGTDDAVVPIVQAHEAKAIKPDIELIEVSGGGHRFGDKMKPGEWEEKVEGFIKELL